MNTSTVKETKQERVQVFALWKKQSKEGKPYFTGKVGKLNLVGFYNLNKKNLKEPDLRVYHINEEGKAGEEYISLWCNTSEKGNKYLSGKLGANRVIGFFNEKATEENKRPYISVYFVLITNSLGTEEKKEETSDLLF